MADPDVLVGGIHLQPVPDRHQGHVRETGSGSHVSSPPSRPASSSRGATSTLTSRLRMTVGRYRLLQVAAQHRRIRHLGGKRTVRGPSWAMAGPGRRAAASARTRASADRNGSRRKGKVRKSCFFSLKYGQAVAWPAFPRCRGKNGRKAADGLWSIIIGRRGLHKHRAFRSAIPSGRKKMSTAAMTTRTGAMISR